MTECRGVPPGEVTDEAQAVSGPGRVCLVAGECGQPEETHRGKGLGRLLTEQAKAIAKQQGVKKLTVQMTADQGAPIGAFSRLGFRKEAYLRNHMIDHDGRPRDVQMLSFDVD